MIFVDLQSEVKRRSVRNQGGTQFDEGIKAAINAALMRVSLEGLWRQLRREDTLETKDSYTTGTGAASVTNASKNFSVTGATFLTDLVETGRKIKFGTDSTYYSIATITSETAGTLDRNFNGTTSTTTSYEVLPKEEYNLPIQSSHRLFLYHNDYGYPHKLKYMTEQEFRDFGVNDTDKGTPTHYRMWTQDMTIQQPLQASVMTISSSSSADTSKSVTVFGIVSGYPDFEVITTNGSNGTTAVAGSKSFSKVDRIVKSSSTTGRITVTSNSAAVTVGVIPVGLQTAGIGYKKIRLWPLPDDTFRISCLYYKDVWKLVNDGDAHELGDQFDEAIILLACTKLKYETDQSEGDRFYALYNDELAVLKRTNIDKVDWLVRLQRPNGRRGDMLNKNLSVQQLGGNMGIPRWL